MRSEANAIALFGALTLGAGFLCGVVAYYALPALATASSDGAASISWTITPWMLGATIASFAAVMYAPVVVIAIIAGWKTGRQQAAERKESHEDD